MNRTISPDEVLVLYKQIARIFPRVNQPNSIEAAQTMAKIYYGFSLQELSGALVEFTKGNAKPPTPADLIDYAKTARINYRMRHASDSSRFHYDSYGNRVYDCPYCQDSGYMCVKWPEENSEFYTPCVHTKPDTMRRFKQDGNFGIGVRKWNWRGHVKWDADLLAFVPVQYDHKERQGEMLTAEELYERVPDMGLPF